MLVRLNLSSSMQIGDGTLNNRFGPRTISAIGTGVVALSAGNVSSGIIY